LTRSKALFIFAVIFKTKSDFKEAFLAVITQKWLTFYIMQKIILVTISLLLSLLVNAGNKNTSGGLKLTTVVIDAGHGGHDPGALGKHIQEKEITLAIALKLGELIKANLPEVKVIYTRSTDVFIELNRRAEIANKNDADLFISIHVNSNPNANASGVDTWVMGQYKNNENFQVAKSENRAILAESNYGSQYEGFDPNSTESYIIFNLMQNAFIGQSLEFATGVQQQVNSDGRKDRGVESAPFLVLWKTTMPSVLVETGFISNEEDEKLLITEVGQAQMANSIYRAFKEYKTKVDNRTRVSLVEQPAAKTTEEKLAIKNTAKEQPKTDKKPIIPAKTDTMLIASTKNISTTEQSKNAEKPIITESKKVENTEQPKTISKTFPKTTTQEPAITSEKSIIKVQPKDLSPTSSKVTTQEPSKPIVKELPKVDVKEQQKAITSTTQKVATQEPTKPIVKELPKVEIKDQQKAITSTTQKGATQEPTKPIVEELPKVEVKEQQKTNISPTPKVVTKELAKPIVKELPKVDVKEQTKTTAATFPKSTFQNQQTISNKATVTEQTKTPISTTQQPKAIVTTPKQPVKTNTNNTKDTINIYFCVQILSSTKRIRLDSSIFKGLDKIREIKLSGAYKYLVGNELEYNNIVLLKNKMRESFPDAFVVALKNGIKIPITEALSAKNNVNK
jgi:N-acetylmuramoyl-L-alanine amidase